MILSSNPIEKLFASRVDHTLIMEGASWLKRAKICVRSKLKLTWGNETLDPAYPKESREEQARSKQGKRVIKGNRCGLPWELLETAADKLWRLALLLLLAGSEVDPFLGIQTQLGVPDSKVDRMRHVNSRIERRM
ncbi:hypothetical protein O6P43_020557 [Quillaja saponaria]|uniref:Uncharacterized protein n=1 Tax=Quillaja saponaria TaxID=32244 RepID=A0AAD7LL12_QUISA|nr:hypothetical protein O6P43_020557 [Quillaja saponaria]